MKRTRNRVASSECAKRRRTYDKPQTISDPGTQRHSTRLAKRRSPGSHEAVENEMVDTEGLGRNSAEETNNASSERPVTGTRDEPNVLSITPSISVSVGVGGKFSSSALGLNKARRPKATDVGDAFDDDNGETQGSHNQERAPDPSNLEFQNIASLKPLPAPSSVAGPGEIKELRPVVGSNEPAEKAPGAPESQGSKGGESDSAKHGSAALARDTAKPAGKKQKRREKESKLPTATGTRIRFGSEEAPADEARMSTAPLEEVLAEELQMDTIQSAEIDVGDTDDEAPETISRVSAVDKYRALTKKVTEAVQQQNEASRSRRRRELKIREEAKQLKKASEQTAAGKIASPQELGDTSFNISENMESTRFLLPSPAGLPALLPDSILNEEAPDNLLLDDVLPPAKFKPKRKGIPNEGKPTKDVKSGPLKVRVLEQTNPLLAPRVSKASEHLKDRWAKGRIGGNKIVDLNIKVRRRKANTGFLRIA